MQAALVAGDYEAFIASISETPLADIITTEADFEQFRAAQELKDDGDFIEANALFEELGVEPKNNRHGHGRGHMLKELSEEQREAFAVAKSANDKATMQAILDEAGIMKSILND
jgi:hypothetical protein